MRDGELDLNLLKERGYAFPERLLQRQPAAMVKRGQVVASFSGAAGRQVPRDMVKKVLTTGLDKA